MTFVTEWLKIINKQIIFHFSFFSIWGIKDEPHAEVTDQVEEEEGPVPVWHRLEIVEVVIGIVDPHKPKIVQQIDWDFSLWTREHIRKVITINFIGERVVAWESDIVRIRNRRVVLSVPVKRLLEIEVLLSVKSLLTGTQCVTGTERWGRITSEGIKGTEKKCERSLHKTEYCPVVPFTSLKFMPFRKSLLSSG